MLTLIECSPSKLKQNPDGSRRHRCDQSGKVYPLHWALQADNLVASYCCTVVSMLVGWQHGHQTLCE